MKKLLPLSYLVLTACATVENNKPLKETDKCMQYRAMMTAPMPPSEYEKLKVACEASQNNLQ